MFGALLGGLFGGGGSGIAGKAIKKAEEFGGEAKFRPVTATGPIGVGTYDPGEGLSYGLGEAAKGVFDPAMAGAAGIFGQLADFDPSQRAQEIYSEQAALLEPQFAQQREQLGQSLFGSGRLGVRMAGESLGLGEGAGMASPEAIAQERLQQQTLAQLAAGSRAQALGEATQLGQLGTGILGAGLSLDQATQNLMKLGLDAETARSVAALGAGQMMLSPYQWAAQMAQQDKETGMDFAGGLLGNKSFLKFLGGF